MSLARYTATATKTTKCTGTHWPLPIAQCKVSGVWVVVLGLALEEVATFETARYQEFGWPVLGFA